jgi:hypothetical protein
LEKKRAELVLTGREGSKEKGREKRWPNHVYTYE